MTETKKRKYSKITMILTTKWLYEMIDRYVYGFFDSQENNPKYKYTIETLERYQDNPQERGWFLTKINRNDIEKHIQGKLEDTMYYTTWAGAKEALICVDIDAHEGQTNAMQVAQWIKDNYFTEAYYEPSTNGAGVHMYIRVSISLENRFFPRAEFNSRMEAFGEALKNLVQDEFSGDSAIVESIRGTVSYTNKKENHIQPGGLAKVPRPKTIEDALKLKNMPTYTMLDIQKVVLDWNQLYTEQNKPKKPFEWSEIGKRTASKVMRKKPVTETEQNLHDKIYDENPNRRVFNTVCELYRRLKRTPTVEEVHTFYCKQGLNTGEDKKNRRIRRIEQAIKKCGKNYDPNRSERYYDIRQYQPNRSMTVLKECMTTERLYSTEYRYRITLNDLDLFADVIADGIINDNLGDEQMFGSISKEFIKKAFEDAKSNKILKSKADNSKVAAMRKLAVEANLIEIVDPTWIHLGQKFSTTEEWTIPEEGETKNRGMKYALAARHPRYDEFLRSKKKHEELVKKNPTEKLQA